HSNDLGSLECAWDVAERNMRGDQCDGDFSTGQTHCEIFHAAAIGKKFRLSAKLEASVVHPSLVNWPGYDGIEFASARQRYGFFKSRRCGARGLNRRLA